MKFTSTTSELPPLDTQVILVYLKGNDQVLTQGELVDSAQSSASGNHSADFWRKLGYGPTYYDYAGRQIQNLQAKKSKNKVIGWAHLPTVKYN